MIYPESIRRGVSDQKSSLRLVITKKSPMNEI